MAHSPPSPAGFALQERLLALEERQTFRRDYIFKRHYTAILLLLVLLGAFIAAAGVAFQVAIRLADRTVARQATLTRTDILMGLQPQASLREARDAELALIDLGMGAATASFEPGAAEAALMRGESTLPREEAFRLADAIEAAGRASGGGGELLADLGRRSRSRQLADSFRHTLRRVYLHVPPSSLAGATEEVISYFKRRGYAVTVVDQGTGRSFEGTVIVVYAFNDRQLATQAAHDFGVAMRRVLGRKRPELAVRRVQETELFGGRPETVEIWLPPK